MRRALVVTVSDRSAEGLREDSSGPAIMDLLLRSSFEAMPPILVADEQDEIVGALRKGIVQRADLIVTTGGTGLAPRDVTPEATLQVVTRTVPGLVALMLNEGLRSTPLAALSRGIAGVAGETLIVNLPGSPRGAIESLEALIPVLPHALDVLRGSGPH